MERERRQNIRGKTSKTYHIFLSLKDDSDQKGAVSAQTLNGNRPRTLVILGQRRAQEFSERSTERLMTHTWCSRQTSQQLELSGVASSFLKESKFQFRMFYSDK